jgi:hypothetical protein
VETKLATHGPPGLHGPMRGPAADFEDRTTLERVAACVLGSTPFPDTDRPGPFAGRARPGVGFGSPPPSAPDTPRSRSGDRTPPIPSATGVVVVTGDHPSRVGLVPSPVGKDVTPSLAPTDLSALFCKILWSPFWNG